MVVNAMGNRIAYGAIDPIAAAEPLKKLVRIGGRNGSPEILEALRLLGYDGESLRTGEQGMVVVKSVEEYFGLVRNQLYGLGHEELHVVTLTRYLGVLAKRMVYKGTVDSIAQVEPRDIFRDALLTGGDYVVMFHNHPTGYVHPSKMDRRTTKTICNAGKMLGVEVLDHLICCDERFFSMRRARMLPKLERTYQMP
ncbi:MAG: JAB domain-containing protein [Chloroflexota bacterium]|nr:JAB domain-containing protein [Chloroflexota bacterium]